MNQKERISKAVSDLPPISEILKTHGFYTKKSLGQNFIFDINFTAKIAKQASDIENSIVIEIGGGAGSLTRAILAENPQKLIVIEKDERCLKILNELKNISEGKLEIINEDALKIDYAELVNNFLRHIEPEQTRSVSEGKISHGISHEHNMSVRNDTKIKIISNLPYNVGTELLLTWYENANIFDEFILMFQKEVAERICAKPSEEAYGRLSIISNILAESEILFLVPPSIFYPQPKVYSAIVKITPREKPLYNTDINKLKKVTAGAFSQRRKTIRNSLKSVLGDDCEKKLISLNINPELRAENLTPEEFSKISIMSNENL